MCTPDKVCPVHAMARLSDELGGTLRRDERGYPFADIRVDLFRARLELVERNGCFVPELSIRCADEDHLTVARIVVMADVLDTFATRCAYVRSILDSDGREWNWSAAEIDNMNDSAEQLARGFENMFGGLASAGEA